MEDEWIEFRRRAWRAHLRTAVSFGGKHGYFLTIERGLHLDRALRRAILHDLLSPPLFVLHL